MVSRAVFIASYIFFSMTLVILMLLSAHRGPKTPYMRAWILFCTLAALFTLLVISSNLASSARGASIIIRMGISMGNLMVLQFLNFIVLFIGLVPKRRLLLGIAMGWTGLLLVLFWATDLAVAGAVPSEFSRFAPQAGPLMPLYGAFIVYAFAVTLFLLIRELHVSSGLKRTQLGYMLASFSVFFVAGALTLLPSILDSQTFLAISPSLIWPLFPIIITYAIIRHRLWDIRTVLHRTVAWAILSLALALPLSLIIWLGSHYLPPLKGYEATALLTLLFLLAYLYLRWVKPPLDHLFQRRIYDSHAVVSRFARQMTGISSPKEVAGNLLDTLARTIYPEGAAVLFRLGGESTWRSLAWPETAPAPSSVEEDHPFVRLVVDHGSAVERSQLEVDRRFQKVAPLGERYFDATCSHVCLPLAQGDALVGMVYLRAKRNLKPYTRDDLELLEQLGSAASIGLANALLFERVDLQRQRLEELTTGLEQKVTDRTQELQRTNAELTGAYESLRDLDRMKNRFFANISHELRTPLTLILAPVESMLEGEYGGVGEEQRQGLMGIRRSSLELLRLIDDLLDLSRLEEARLRLILSRVDLRSLTERILDFTRPLAQRKEVELALLVVGDVEVEADEEKLERVIVNLLSNALKFTDQGGRVDLRMEGREEDVRLWVTDTGIGIPPGEISYIFDRFHQVDPSITGRQGGSGIGLALARELVDLHGGRLSVTSELGRGSSFLVEIPRETKGLPLERIDRRVDQIPVLAQRREGDCGLREWSEALLARPEYRFMDIDKSLERRLEPRALPVKARRARLLVVDDNADMLQYLHRLLGDAYEVWTVLEGQRAWELMLKHRHDLVLADIMMPGMSGLDLCHRIKADPRTQDTPVILLTARAASEHRIQGHEVGADQYMTKPFIPAEIKASIESHLTQRERRTEMAARRRATSLETLLAGMAHELGNACHQAQNAQSAISLLMKQLGGSGFSLDTLTERLTMMEGVSHRALERIALVVESFGRYARNKMTAPWRNHNLDRLVEREARLAMGGEATLELELNSKALVRGPEEELRQVVLNLVENAAQAVSQGGLVRVTTVSLGSRAILSVEDNGCGIPADLQGRVFDLFFTTKAPGQGTGLGLALCERTVMDLGGNIALHSQEGVGTRAVVELPLAESLPLTGEPA